MRIRAARAVDIEELSKLDVDLEKYEKKFDQLINVGGTKDAEAWLKKKIKDMNFKIFIAFDNGKMVGFIHGWIEKSDLLIKEIGYICDCYVDRKYRGFGIGKQLVGNLMKWFKSNGIKYAKLNVYSENKSAIKTWESMGFKEIEKEMRAKLD